MKDREYNSGREIKVDKTGEDGNDMPYYRYVGKRRNHSAYRKVEKNGDDKSTDILLFLKRARENFFDYLHFHNLLKQAYVSGSKKMPPRETY